MKKNDFEELKDRLKSGSSLKIGVIDNNLMDFLVRINNETDILHLFDDYDIILIPKWVEVEINDGQTRIDCLDYIATKKDVYIIDEKNYSDLANYKDFELMLLFQASSSCMGKIMGEIRRLIATEEDKEELDYENFIDELYDNILKEKNVEPGKRAKRKNAGELSICVLCCLLMYYYEGIESITVFTFDQDCYKYIKNTKESLYQKDNIAGIINKFKHKESCSVTFKSNDWILKQLYALDEPKGIQIINRVRTNSRYIKYTLKKSDGSIEENTKLIDTTEFIEFIKSKDIHLIF
ncbi:hypothetical protein [Tepidibacter sp. Z1-5]|uniref:hypothetical protein n=1 Tax=Tepidibacter sp. Z1-5 TaxID=3134138 RepID=UPI0030BDD5E8